MSGTTRQDPATGNFLSNGPGINLTPGQRAICTKRQTLGGDPVRLARLLLNRDEPWLSSRHMEWTDGNVVEDLVLAKVLTEVRKGSGFYYKFTGQTRPWALTCLALHEEMEAKK